MSSGAAPPRWEKNWADLTTNDDALHTNLWHDNWVDIEAIWIGRTPSGQEALTIQPTGRSDQRQTGSKLSRISYRLDRPFGKRSVHLADGLFYRPLDEAIDALSARAGRPFGAPPTSAPH